MDRLRVGARARNRSVVAVALVAAVFAGGWAFASQSASAHWSEPKLEASCATDGGWAVWFKVESWKRSEKLGGANPRIEVAYQVDGGEWTTLPWQPTYAFNGLNGFEFEDHFQVPPADVSKARIKVWTHEAWSDGYRNKDPRYSGWVHLPTTCKPEPTTTTAPPTTAPPTTAPPTTAPPTTAPPTTAPSTTKPPKPTTTKPPKPTTTKPHKPTTTTTKPTTTVPPTTAPPTTAPPTTAAPTTTVVVSPTSIVAEPTTTKPATVAPPVPAAPTPSVAVKSATATPLPHTGARTAGMLGLAAVLLAVGLVALRASRIRG